MKIGRRRRWRCDGRIEKGDEKKNKKRERTVREGKLVGVEGSEGAGGERGG
jgi:hypothetical protein